MDDKVLRNAAIGKVIVALMVLGAITVAEVIGVVIAMFMGLPDDSMAMQAIPEWFGAVVAIGGMALMGGASWIACSREKVAYTFRYGWWCLAISVALVAYDLFWYVADGTPVSPDWLRNTIECAVMCLAIGIIEEFMFRGVIFNALLALMGGTHRGVVRAVIVTSIIFGFAHVDFTSDFGDALSVVQALLKVVQTGMYSVLLCVIVLRTRELGGVSLFHGFDDFLILVPSVALFDEGFEIDYVTTGDGAVEAALYYVLVIALYLPFVIKALRDLRRGQDVYRGVFMEKAVAQAAVRALPPAGGSTVSVPVPPVAYDAGQAAPAYQGIIEPVAVPSWEMVPGNAAASDAVPCDPAAPGAVPQEGIDASVWPQPSPQAGASPSSLTQRRGGPPAPTGL